MKACSQRGDSHAGGVTENELILAWQPMVQQEARAKKSPLEPEDKAQIATMGLLHAIRTYRVGMRPFEDYARDCIRAYLIYYDRCYRRCTRAESRLSLDAQIRSEDGTATYGDYLLTFEEPAFA